MKNFISILFALFIFSFYALGEIPAGYYNNAEGKSGAALKTALYNIIKGHTSIGYSALWTAFQSTDKRSDGKVWDMYSNCTFTFVNNQCGNYSSVCDCYNREHSFPKSWFGGSESSTQGNDLFHMYPTDGKVNGYRSNYPFGEVSNNTQSELNGTGTKLGQNTYPGYTGIVFEPADEYKGDFARTYFYMATRYENVFASWGTDYNDAKNMLAGNAYPGYKTWVINMLLEWHQNDPVSQKEIDRNNAVYTLQHNRNPFIDHPEYAICIWNPSNCSTDINITAIADENTAIRIFPNPVQDVLQIECAECVEMIEILDLSGRIIETIYATFLHDGITKIDVSALPKGVYLVKIGENIGKFVKE